MSYRIGLSGIAYPWLDFSVPRDGTVEQLVETVAWSERPIKVVFRDAEDLRLFLDAWEAEGPPVRDIWRIYHEQPDGKCEWLCEGHADRATIERALSEQHKPLDNTLNNH